MSSSIATDFILLSAIWGSSFLFMRLGALEFGAMPTAALRVAIASVFLLPLVVMRGHLTVLRTHWRRIFAIGLINSGIPFACFAFASLFITTGLSAILNATVPLFGAIVAWLWFREALSPSRIVGLAIGFAGVAVLAWGQASFKPGATGVATGWAILACLAAAVFYGLAANASKRYLAGLPALVTAAGSQLGATLGLALPAAWAWPEQLPGPRAWGAMLALGVLCTGVAYILYFRLIERAGPARAVACTFVVPVFAVLYGAVLLSEPVTMRMVAAGALIACGTALSIGLLRLPGARR